MVPTWIAAAVVFAACGLGFPQQFTHTLPAERGWDPLPIVLVDRTGKVVGIKVVNRLGFPDSGDGVQAVPGSNAVIVNWISGACDERVAMTFESRSGEGLFTIATARPPNPCILIARGRRLLVRFLTPVDGAALSVEESR